MGKIEFYKNSHVTTGPHLYNKTCWSFVLDKILISLSNICLYFLFSQLETLTFPSSKFCFAVFTL